MHGAPEVPLGLTVYRRHKGVGCHLDTARVMNEDWPVEHEMVWER
jgi:hypothetical protein